MQASLARVNITEHQHGGPQRMLVRGRRTEFGCLLKCAVSGSELAGLQLVAANDAQTDASPERVFLW